MTLKSKKCARQVAQTTMSYYVHSKKGGRRHDDFCNLMLHQFVQTALAGPTSIFVKIMLSYLSLKDRYCGTLIIFSES